MTKFPDGFNGVIQTGTWETATGRHIQRRLVSVGHRDKVAGACPLAVEYHKVEKFVMALLYQLKPSDLFPKTSKSDKGIKEKEQALHGMEARKAELEAALGNSKQPVPQLLTAIAELTTKQNTIKQEIDHLRQHEATATARPLEQFQDILKTLEKRPEAERHDLRLKLRGLIADIVEKVEIEPYRVGRSVEAVLRVFCQTGLLADNHLAVDTAAPLEQVKDIMKHFDSLAKRLETNTQEQRQLGKEIGKADLKGLEKVIGAAKTRRAKRILADKGI
jgi:septal ring factor EnvC (AmiA/AmiB activator)